MPLDVNQEMPQNSPTHFASSLNPVLLNYWNDLKRKLKQEGNQLYENLVQHTNKYDTISTISTNNSHRHQATARNSAATSNPTRHQK